MRVLVPFLLIAVVAAQQKPPDLQAALQAAAEQLANAVRTNGEESLETAAARHRFGLASFRLGHLDEAQAAATAVLAVRERLLPADDLLIAEPLMILGAVAGRQLRLSVAAEHYQRAHAIQSRHKPPDDPYVQMLAYNLATTWQQLGDRERAAALARPGLERSIARQGAASLAAANWHGLLAQVEEGLGNLPAAFDHARAATRILRAAFGEDHVDVVRLDGIAGMIACRMGRWDDGLPMLSAAASRMASLPGAPRGHVVELSCALAILRTIHDADGAVDGLRRALADALTLQAEDESWSDRVLVLASALALSGEATDLEAMRRTLATCERTLGPDHPHIPSLIGGVGLLEVVGGDLEAGRATLRRAIQRIEQGPHLPSTDRIKLLAWAAMAERRSGSPATALELMRKAIDELPSLLATWVPTLSDQQRVECAASMRSCVDAVLDLTRETEPEAGWAAVLAWKGLAGRGLSQQLRWLQEHADPVAVALRERLRASVTRWSALGRAGAPAAMVASADRERADLELALSARLQTTPMRIITPAAVRQNLGTDEVLLDFHLWNRPTWLSAGTADEQRLLVFGATRDGAVQRFDLGPVAPIREALGAWLQLTARWTRPAAQDGATILAAGRALADLVWSPLASFVGQRPRVLVCADGAIAPLPFAALPTADGGFLLERHEFLHLQGGLDLASPATPMTGGALCAVGDVDYGSADAGAAERSGVRGLARLPESAGEIDAVVASHRARFGADATVRQLRGGDASTQAFTTAVAGMSFVHVATHGWLRPAPPDAPGSVRRFFDRLGTTPGGSAAPGLLAGLAFAHANLAAEAEDGVLTADELVWLDLHDCQLAVLSACESGLGTENAGDALLGLRRSLRLAGARRSLTTVWRVGDRTTRELMTGFYRRLWQEGVPPAQALRQAQIELLAQNRRAHGQALAGNWGAFLLEGR